MNALTPTLRRATLLAASLLFITSVRAADDAPANDSPLHQHMEEMGKGMRVLARGLNSADPAPAKADYLEALQKMQLLAIESKVLVPASVEKLPEAERPARLAAYRADLASAIVILLQLEQAVIADDWPKAKEIFGQLRNARKDGHDKYNPEEQH